MDTGKRDPRQSPRTGDVLRTPDGITRRVYGPGETIVAWQSFDGDAYGPTTWSTWDEWRRDCATATVVTVAGEEGR